MSETYKAKYNNASSLEFKNFSSDFKKTVGEFLGGKLFGFQRVEVTKLSNGSVVVDFDIVVKKSSNATVGIIVEALKDGNGTQLGYTLLEEPTVRQPQQPSSSITLTGTDNIKVFLANCHTFYFITIGRIYFLLKLC